MNYLRALNFEMGAPVNRFRVMARMALRGKAWRNDPEEVARDAAEYKDTWNALAGQADKETTNIAERTGWARGVWERAVFELNLLYADAVRWVGQVLFAWMADPSLQHELQRVAKNAGEENNPLFGG